MIVISYHPSTTYPSLIHIYTDSALWIRGYSTCSSQLPVPRSLPLTFPRDTARHLSFWILNFFLRHPFYPLLLTLPQATARPSSLSTPFYTIYPDHGSRTSILSFGYIGKSAMIRYRAFFSAGRALVFFFSACLDCY